MSVIIAGFFLFSIAAHMFNYVAHSCNGYYLTVNKFKNCAEENVLRLKDFNVSLTNDCKVIPSGCIETTAEITNATVNYKISKNMISIVGSKDGCGALSGAREEVVTILKFFALPTSCPMKAGKVCGADSKSVDISKYKNKLAILLGDIKATININTDAGPSCLVFEGSFKRAPAVSLPSLG